MKDAAQNPLVINSRHSPGWGKMLLDPVDMFIGKPEKVLCRPSHTTVGALKNAVAKRTFNRSMGFDLA